MMKRCSVRVKNTLIHSRLINLMSTPLSKWTVFLAETVSKIRCRKDCQIYSDSSINPCLSNLAKARPFQSWMNFRRKTRIFVLPFELGKMMCNKKFTSQWVQFLLQLKLQCLFSRTRKGSVACMKLNLLHKKRDIFIFQNNIRFEINLPR